MEQVFSQIQTKVDYLQNKLSNYKSKRFSKDEMLASEKWTKTDADMLSDLLNISRFVQQKCYNAVLDDIKVNGDSIVEQYCELKKNAILNEMPKHKSKYILKEYREELENLDKVIANKNNFVESKKSHTTSYEAVGMSLKSGLSDSVRSQLNAVYLSDSLNPSYKVVLDDLLSGNLANYNKLGQINVNKKEMRELGELSSHEAMWEINNKIDNHLYNSFSNINEQELFKEVSSYVSKFIKYSDDLKKHGISLPTVEGNYYNNVQKFLLQIKTTDVLNKIADEIKEESSQLKSELPKEYNDIEYGFFGTVSGTPGVAYYFNNPSKTEEAKNVKVLYEILGESKKLESKNLDSNIVEQVNQDLVSKIEGTVSPKSR